jgi:hypothetical protein
MVVAIVTKPQIVPSTDPRTLFRRLIEARPNLLVFVSRGLDPKEAWREVLYIMARSEQSGDSPDIGASVVLNKSEKARTYRELRERVRAGTSPSYLLGIARDHAKRFYINEKKREMPVLGKSERGFFISLTKNLEPDTVIFVDKVTNRTITAREYYSWIRSNKPISSDTKRVLYAMSSGNGNQGPGIGAFNERRAGYVLSKLTDANLIKNFWICGEASSPLFVKDSRNIVNHKFDYAMHEEAMAVDLIAHLKPEGKEKYEYVAMQIKSTGSLGFRESKRFLSFDADQKSEFEKLVPESKALFIKDTSRSNKFFLPVLRNVFHLPMNDRKIARSGPKDYSDDIANQMMATFEFMQNHNMTIKLDRPYQKLSYSQKVQAMIESGGLRLDFEKPVNPYDKMVHHAN